MMRFQIHQTATMTTMAMMTYFTMSETHSACSVTVSQALPAAARDYVEFIEKNVACPIKFVSVGAERDSLIIR